MKVQPQAIDIEKVILGALMLEKNAIDKVPLLKPEHFYDESNGNVYQAILDLSVNSSPIDLLTVSQQLKKNKALDSIGGVGYLAELTSKITSTANIEYHSALVIQKYNLREIIRVSSLAADMAFNENADPFDIQATMLTDLEKTQLKGSGEAVSLSKAAIDYIKELETIQSSDKLITGIDTGYHKINQITNGWHAPNLIIMAGRPGTGKTASALNFTYNIIMQKIPVAFFSLEMSTRELMGRLMSISAGIGSERLRNADLGEKQWQAIHKQNFNLPLYIDDTSGMNVLEFKSKARRMVKKYGVKFIVVDYLQLMTANVKGNREQEISFISRTLKQIAKELNVPILALAQMSRDVEKRTNGRPRLSDLRECLSTETSQIYTKNNVLFNTDSQINLLSLNNNKIETMESTNIPKSSNVVYRLKTRTGRFIDCTANHTILTTSGYKALKDITKDDSIAIASGWDCDGGEYIPESKFIGWMLGNGCMYGYNVPSFITSDKVVSDNFCSFVNDKWGFLPKFHPHHASQVYQWDITKNSVRVPEGNPVTNWLKDNDLWGKKAKDKYIPEWFIEKSNHKSIKELIQGLWETDGSIVKGKYIYASYATTSLKLANQLIYLLAKIGIVASIDNGYKSNKATTPCYKVIIKSNDQMLKFKYLIQLDGIKGIKLQQLSAVESGSNLSNKLNRDTTLDIANITYSLSKSTNRVQTHGNRRLTKFRLKELLLVYPEQLKNYSWIASDNIYWDSINSIVEIGERTVFDRNVPVSSNFVVNGIIVHNSGSLEQDADIVIFLYDENADDKSVQTTKIEFIWAKHRNGACLSTDLEFNKPTQKFNSIL